MSMYKRILKHRALPLKKRIRSVVEYYLLKRSSRIIWNNRDRKLFSLSPELNAPLEKAIEKAHIEYWKEFRHPVNLATFRICSNASGTAHPEYVPEEVFRDDIEPTLNRTPSVDYLQFKSLYNRLFSPGLFPIDYIHNIEGEWLDSHYNSISFDEVKSIAKKLEYPLVCKPNKDSGGGKGVVFPGTAEALTELLEHRSNLVVQKKIVQHPFYEQFNAHDISSVRVNIYRSVVDNRHHVISMNLRIGIGGSLDNLSDGGIFTRINDDGQLCGFASNVNGVKYMTHPETGEPFNKKIPDVEGLKRISLEVARKLYYTRLVALDVCYDKDANWRVIEINLFSGTLKMPQYSGETFFGAFTDEIKAYCLANHWAFK